MPEISKDPEYDQWKVSGVGRSFASHAHAERVRSFLRDNPPSHIKRALETGQTVDHLLPKHLQKLPDWNEIFGTGTKEEAVAKGSMTSLAHIGKAQRRIAAQALKPQRSNTKGLEPVLNTEDTLLHPFVFQQLSEVFAYTLAALNCGCIDKLEWSCEKILHLLGEEGTLAEWRSRRRNIGIRRAKHFRVSHKIREGRAKKIKNTIKMHRPWLTGVVYSRHR